VSDAIKGLKPEPVWRYLYELNQIPRGSKNEAAAQAWLVSVAEKLGMDHEQDEAGNVLIRKPATAGRENAPTVVLQGHTDMVCEKNADTVHDFVNDPITMLRDGDWITADGTTLGADNGIGVAAALAVLEDKDVVHGPLEMLFTVDEETGLTGANELQPGWLKGKVMLNMDSEEDGTLYVGCAGGVDTIVTFKADRDAAPTGMSAVELKVSGLKGGHSGLDIHEGRGNALKMMTRFLRSSAAAELGLKLVSWNGGNLRNAIPRESVSTVLVPQGKEADLAKAVADQEATYKDEIGDLETALSFAANTGVAAEGLPAPLTHDAANRLTSMIQVLPHGVVSMSRAIPGLVETSTNVASIKEDGDTFTISTSQRSSAASQKLYVSDLVLDGARLSGADATQGDGYPGWNPDMSSTVLAKLSETHEELFGKKPAIKAIHAGLECGIIGEKFPGMDMISFGPTITGAHSPDERIKIDTVENFWKLACGVLDKLSA
jgi:dipeptidase D